VSFPNNAFISYSSADRPWAERIAQGLEAKGLSVFLDKRRLIAGRDWDDQLHDELENSQHMVVLWSENAKASDWVQAEIGMFRALARTSARRVPPGPARHIIPVYLEGDNAQFARYEHIDLIRSEGAYPGDAHAVAPGVWQAVMESLENGIVHPETARPLPLLVITTTKEALSSVDADKPLPPPPDAGESLNELIQRLGIGSRDDLLASYGEGPSDWRPFGSACSVKGILEQLKDAINLQLKREELQEFRWDYLDDEFWSGKRARIAERLRREPVVIVLDPLSLYDEAVAWAVRDWVLRPVRENGKASVIVLSPFRMPPNATALRDSIQRLARDIFESYYNPPVRSTTRYARYVTSVGDEVDLKASVLAGIGPLLARQTGGGGVENRFLET
jgi:hypothetical protein